MEITQDVSFTTEHDGMTDTVYASSYSPEEQENNQINRNNSELLVLPEFVCYYPSIAKKFELSHLETLIYGYLRFFLNGDNKVMYASNKTLAETFSCSERTLAQAMSNLNRKGVIKPTYKMKANGGKLRIIRSSNIYFPIMQNNVSSNHTELHSIKNNIIKNISNIDIGPKSYGNELVNYAISEFERVLTYPPTSNRGQTARQGAWNWVRSIQAQLKGKPDSEMSLIVRRLVTSELEWVKRQEWGQITNFAPLSKNLYKFIALLRDGKERLRDAVQETR